MYYTQYKSQNWRTLLTLHSPADHGGLSRAQGARPGYGDTGTAGHNECSALVGFLAITSQPLGPEVIYNHLHNNGLTLIKLVNFPEH